MCHGDKLRSKDSFLYSFLLLRKPTNKCHIHEDHIARTGAAISLISHMVTIYHHSKDNFLTPWSWGVDRNWFIDVPILLGLVLGLKCSFVDGRIIRVHCKTIVVLHLEVPHPVQDNFKVAITRVYAVRAHY